ncbi:MAG: hypothetical protein C5B54_03175, partial [Acidobacteria bacterium]
SASTLTVNSTADSGPGTLRDTIATSNSGDTVNFDPTVVGTISLTTGEIAINKTLTITGPGADIVTVSGNNLSRVFNIAASPVTISGLTIADGTSGGNGGGIFIAGDGISITVDHCTLLNNQTPFGTGGAISASGPTTGPNLTIMSSTFLTNTAQGNGGAIDSPGITLNISQSSFIGNITHTNGGALSIGTGTTTITNSTFAQNHADGHGGAINDGGFGVTYTIKFCTISGNTAGTGGGIQSTPNVTARDSIIAGNTASVAGPNCSGTITDGTFNLVDDQTNCAGFGGTTVGGNPLLRPLAARFGAPLTFGLATNSPAIDAGNNTGAPGTDEAGTGRPVNGTVDIGATEANCTFCDDFNDSLVDVKWTYTKSINQWSEDGASLVGTATKKVTAVASPVFNGCQKCVIETTMQTNGAVGNKIWFYGWRTDKNNGIELLMKQERNKWILRQRVGGVIVAKAKATRTINIQTNYTIRIDFDGSIFRVFMDTETTPMLTLTAVGSPSGTVGFGVRGTVGSFDYIAVN